MRVLKLCKGIFFCTDMTLSVDFYETDFFLWACLTLPLRKSLSISPNNDH